MIIEDEMIVALEVQYLLQDLGYESFDIAATPQEAVRHALSRRPDLITADVMISGGTGIDAVREIIRRVGAIPHFYVTGTRDMLVGELAPVIVDKPIQHLDFVRACVSAFRGTRASS